MSSQGACEPPGSSMGPRGSGGFGPPSHGALAPGRGAESGVGSRVQGTQAYPAPPLLNRGL